MTFSRSDASCIDVPVSGGSLSVHEWRLSARADALPLVLLHGFTGAGRSFEQAVALLAYSGRVLAPDLPGHGLSRIANEPETHTMESVASALDEALFALEAKRFALGGYSMGGRLALYYAITRPHAVTRLVLESASAGLATEAERSARVRADDELACFALDAGIERFVDRWERTPVLATQARLAETERARVRARRLACTPAGLAASLRGMGAGAQPHLGTRLGDVRAPTLVLAGAEDTKFRAIAQKLAADIGGAKLEIIEKAGHTPHLEAPVEWAEVVGKFVNAGRTTD